MNSKSMDNAIAARPPLGITMAAVAGLICYGILTIWVSERWALAAYQAGIFAIALAWAVRMAARPFPLRWGPALLLMGGPVLWALVPLAAGPTASRWAP